MRCRKGKTKCVYENGRAPCKNCAKGLHDCYLPSESMSHGGHGVSPARVQQRARESLPSERTVSSTSGDRQAPPASSVSRHVSTTTEKYVHFSFLSVDSFVFLLQFHFGFFFLCAGGCLFWFASFLSFSALFSGRAPSAAPFFARSRLPPPAESFVLPVGSRRRAGKPQFSPPAFNFPNRHTQFSLAPCAPSRLTSDCLGLGTQQTEVVAVTVRVTAVAILRQHR